MSRIGKRTLVSGGFFKHEPLGDDSVIRFQLNDDDSINVRIVGNKLELQHESRTTLRSRIAVMPVAGNVMNVVLVPGS